MRYMFISIAIACLAGCVRTQSAPTKAEIVQLLFPRSFDMPSQEEVTNMNRVVAFGPQIMPILAAIVSEQNDSLNVSRVLSIAAQIEGDHTPILKTLPALLQNPDNRIQIAAIKAFGRWGGADDCQYILPLATSDNEFVRLHAVRTLGYLGDRRTAAALRTLITLRAAEIRPDQNKHDSTVKFGAIALSNILERVESRGSETRHTQE